MEIQSSTQTTALTERAQRAQVTGKDDFLLLLVTQLKNQDPLDPQDPSEFTAQLAQFTSLEQMMNMGEAMDRVAEVTKNDSKLSALSLIGTEVLSGNGIVEYDGGPLEIGYRLEEPVDSVQVSIVDLDGNVKFSVAGNELNKGDHFLTWNGQGLNGSTVPNGPYRIQVTSMIGEEDIVATTPLSKGRVSGVDLSLDQLIMDTDFGRVPLNDLISASL